MSKDFKRSTGGYNIHRLKKPRDVGTSVVILNVSG